MPWFQIKSANDDSIQQYDSLENAYLNQFSQHNWSCKINKIHISKLNIKDLEYFLLELLKGLESGLKLHFVLQHMHQGAHSKKIRRCALALSSELILGENFNYSLKKVVDATLHSYCDLFVKSSTPEQLRTNLAIMHEQIRSLQSWTKGLAKALIYPFFVMQVALIMWLTHSIINIEKEIIILQNVSFYSAISITQVFIYKAVGSNITVKILENRLISFRLNKLFCLLKASLYVGNSLQRTLTQLPDNFSNPSIRQDLLMVYYKLRLGRNYIESFPKYWFPQESLLALNASSHSGDINRALVSAAQLHDANWQRQLTLIGKVFPIITLIIAGGFVSQTLIDIYTPLLKLP